MTRFFTLLVSYLILSQTQAQGLSAPVAEGVYGGQLGDFETWAFSSDSIYCVVSTDSPNSIFWAKANRSANRNNLAWEPLPSADADDGFGGSIMNIEIHQTSHSIFFLAQGTVYKTDFGASTATAVDSMVKEFMIHGDTMALVKNNPMAGGQDVLDFGSLSTSGGYLKIATINLLKNYTEAPQMLINHSDQKLHLFERGNSPHRYELQDPFYAMTASTALASALNPAPVRANIEWRTYGFNSSGTWFVAGQPPLNNPTMLDRRMAYSNNNGLSWVDTTMNTPGPIGGVVGNNMVFQNYAGGTAQALYIGNAVEQDLSSFGNWVNPGAVYIDGLNRANDGYTKIDPIDPNLVYHSTNIGFGYSTQQGDSIFGWNEGLTAVQVNDIDMNRSFSTGWVASKSGLRKVENYKTSPVWSNPMFPNFDGAPYTAIAMTPGSDDTIYAGNQRVYRSQNGGTAVSPTNDGWDQVFSPEMAPWNFNRINSHCTSIAVAPDSANIVLAGYSIDFADQGGCFYSLDGGNNWQQLLLNATGMGQDLDVNDIVITREAGALVAYIGLASDPISSGQYGLFRAELGTSGWTLSREPGFSATDAIIDLELNDSGDSLYVLNYDPGLLPVSNVYIKDLNSGSWSNFAGPSANGEASAITDGDGFVFVSLDERIYINTVDGSLGWSLGYAYPVGTDINVLFYDELLVGTGTGLYAHDLDAHFTVDESQKAQLLNLYPNPSKGVLHLSKAQVFSVFDLWGREVHQGTSATDYLDCQSWPNGIYILRVASGESHKFLLQKN